jgi:tetratricopeptide (TPR) repeat protein
VHIERRMEEPIDPLLNNAYLAYRGGNFEQSQQLYLKALSLDSNNTDALLGLGVLAQRRGEDSVAAHYYARVLALDPRNAVANSGMSALSDDSNRESRLKMLLNEQPNSSSLHFALGNYYAEQARWSEAQQSYFDAYKLAPDHAELDFNLAVSLDRLGQNKAAAQFYRRALQLDPGHHADFDHAKISQRIEELTH